MKKRLAWIFGFAGVGLLWGLLGLAYITQFSSDFSFIYPWVESILFWIFGLLIYLSHGLVSYLAESFFRMGLSYHSALLVSFRVDNWVSMVILSLGTFCYFAGSGYYIGKFLDKRKNNPPSVN